MTAEKIAAPEIAEIVEQIKAGGRRVYRSAPVLRMAIILSVMLGVGSVFLWFQFDPRIRALFTLPQVGTLIFFVLFMVAFMVSIGASSAVVTNEGIKIRNCVSTKFNPWETVKNVSFGDGDPWAYLQLNVDQDHPEGRSRMILGIQHVEGEAAVERVKELRALIREFI